MTVSLQVLTVGYEWCKLLAICWSYVTWLTLQVLAFGCEHRCILLTILLKLCHVNVTVQILAVGHGYLCKLLAFLLELYHMTVTHNTGPGSWVHIAYILVEDTQGMLEATAALQEVETENLQHCSHQKHRLILHCVTSPSSTSTLSLSGFSSPLAAYIGRVLIKEFKCCARTNLSPHLFY